MSCVLTRRAFAFFSEFASPSTGMVTVLCCHTLAMMRLHWLEALLRR